MRLKRVAVLFSRLSGYMAACLKALKRQTGVQLLVFRAPLAKEAPFESSYFDWIDSVYTKGQVDLRELQKLVVDFDPQVIFMSGWMDQDYLHIARKLKKIKKTLVVAGSDTQYNNSLRQHVGRLVAPWYLHSAIDVLWVAGERQRQLARWLGYSGQYCWSGVYACDWERFGSIYAPNTNSEQRAFLYVGRYVSVKGLDILTEAYKMYRTLVANPWPLICAGAGAHKSKLSGQEGIIDHGFIQPDHLPELMQKASAFVLPSKKEPWGVVVQEAAAAGLPLICSDASGATVHLLQDQYNGFLFESGNAEHLAYCMKRMTQASEEDWASMSHRSHMLSKQFTPETWARTFIQGVDLLRSNTN